MNRVEHVLFGTGTVIEPRTTEGGRAAYLVRFDGTETDRLILADSLKSSSSAPVDSGEAPKKGRKKAIAPVKKSRRKTAYPPVEVISDQLLVPALDDTVNPVRPVEWEESQVSEEIV